MKKLLASFVVMVLCISGSTAANAMSIDEYYDTDVFLPVLFGPTNFFFVPTGHGLEVAFREGKAAKFDDVAFIPIPLNSGTSKLNKIFYWLITSNHEELIPQFVIAVLKPDVDLANNKLTSAPDLQEQLDRADRWLKEKGFDYNIIDNKAQGSDYDQFLDRIEKFGENSTYATQRITTKYKEKKMPLLYYVKRQLPKTHKDQLVDGKHVSIELTSQYLMPVYRKAKNGGYDILYGYIFPDVYEFTDPGPDSQ